MSKDNEKDASDLGPLPGVPRTDELERLSYVALDSILPQDQFLLRGEIKDKGVDGSIELLINRQATNLRAQIQLKSTDSANANQDGSISYSIDTSNLNYLLYGGNTALYILYIAPNKELRFAWASDERRRLDQENPEWMQQGTVTIRFRDLLTLETTNHIHQRILREGRLHREINDNLSRASLNEQVTVTINPETLETIDPAETKELILTSGVTMVSSGYGSLVLQAIDTLRASDKQLPRILTIKIHAHYTLGEYQDALACIGKALLHQDELAPEDRRLLIALRDSCRYETGQIDYTEFSRLLEEAEEEEDDDLSFPRRLNQLRYALRHEDDLVGRRNMIMELRLIVGEMQVSTKVSTATKLDAKLALLEAEGHLQALDSTQLLFQIHIRGKLGTLTTDKVQATLAALTTEFAQWHQMFDSSVHEAQRLKNPLLIGKALSIRATFNFLAFVMTRRSFLLLLGQDVDFPADALRAMMEEATQTLEIFKQAGQLEGELRAQLTLADLFLLGKQPDAAKRLASSVLPKAQAMDYITLQTRAMEHLSGETPFQMSEKVILESATVDMDEKLAHNTDEELLNFARSCLQALDLPQERLPVVERDIHSMRTMASERLNWCKHIEITQDLRHTAHPATCYLSDPERFGHCLKHQFKSVVGHTDTDTVVSAFKNTYCENCQDREAKNA